MQDCKNRPERLDKLLASSGLVTRSEARAAVARGRVTVDGVPAHSPEQKVTREAALCLDGAPVDTAPFLYIMLNKPAGYVCSTDDGDGPTVLDLLTGPERRRGLFPAGRLDKDTVGLLLLTNDGASAHRWLSPKRHVEKRYFFRCARPLDELAAASLERGVDIGGVVTKPARLTVQPGGTEGLLTITEGKFHQIKRMLAAVGERDHLPRAGGLRRPAAGPGAAARRIPKADRSRDANAAEPKIGFVFAISSSLIMQIE